MLEQGNLRAQVEGILGRNVDPRLVRQEGIYERIPWQPKDGGTVSRELLRRLDELPTVRDAMNADDLIPQIARNKYEVDAAAVAADADTVREGLQNLRRIIGDGGPGWVERVRTALVRREVLPAVAAALLGPEILENRERW